VKLIAPDVAGHDARVATQAEPFAKRDLEEALRALASRIRKCEKVQPKLKPGSSQHTLLVRRIEALRIACVSLERELDACAPEDP